MKKITCEVCVETVDDAIRAEQAGADRIELCADLAVGGTTPSAGLIRTIAKQVSIPVMVMIRPRPGDFCFSEHEKTKIRVWKDYGSDVPAFHDEARKAFVFGEMRFDFAGRSQDRQL